MERLMRRLNGSLSRSVRRSVQDIFQQSPLDLRFALQKTLDPRITFTRASSGTYVDSQGVIQRATTNLYSWSEDFSNAAWSKSEVTVTADATTAPNGSATADQLTPSTTNAGHTFSRLGIIGSAGTFTDSIYAKANGYSFLVSTADSGGFVIYDLSNGTINSSSVATGSITAAGNGWYRCSTTRTTTAAATVQYQIRQTAGTFSYTGDGTSGIFVWGAQLEQSSTVGEYIPTTSTINSAPRFDHSITSSVTNLLLRSEEFDNANWTKNDGPTVTANQITAPNGTITADQIVGNGAATGYLEQAIPITNGLSYVFSIYLKKRTASTVNTLLYGSQFNSGGGNQVATWNLDTGTASFTNGATGSMTAVGDGWFRCVMRSTATTTNASSANQLIRLVGNSGDAYIWGAQLEQSSTVGTYVPTTTAPATRATTESLGLLVEEQRTNLIVRSEELDDAAWTKGGSTISTNATTALTGLVTADKIQEDNSNSSHRVISTAPAWAGSTAYTLTFYAKSAERTLVYGLVGTSIVASRLLVIFDLATGTATTSSGSPTATSITALANGWYRCSITFTSIASPTGGVVFGIWNTAEVYTGTTGSGLFVWGSQLEAGSFPTSYIPTTTAAVTRSADVASITGSNFSSWYRQDEGTVFAETQLYSTFTRNAAGFDINDNSTNNRVIFRAFTTGSFDQYTVRSGGSTEVQIASAGTPSTTIRKSAVTISLNSYAISANGASPTEDTSGALPISVSQLLVGSAQAGTEFMGGTIRRLTYWPSRLPNATLQQITQ